MWPSLWFEGGWGGRGGIKVHTVKWSKIDKAIQKLMISLSQQNFIPTYVALFMVFCHAFFPYGCVCSGR